MQFKINSIFLKSIFRYDGIEFIGAFRKLKNVSCGVITTIVSQVTLPVQKDFLEQLQECLVKELQYSMEKERRRNGCARFLNFNIDE